MFSIGKVLATLPDSASFTSCSRVIYASQITHDLFTEYVFHKYLLITHACVKDHSFGAFTSQTAIRAETVAELRAETEAELKLDLIPLLLYLVSA